MPLWAPYADLDPLDLSRSNSEEPALQKMPELYKMQEPYKLHEPYKLPKSHKLTDLYKLQEPYKMPESYKPSVMPADVRNLSPSEVYYPSAPRTSETSISYKPQETSINVRNLSPLGVCYPSASRTSESSVFYKPPMKTVNMRNLSPPGVSFPSANRISESSVSYKPPVTPTYVMNLSPPGVCNLRTSESSLSPRSTCSGGSAYGATLRASVSPATYGAASRTLTSPRNFDLDPGALSDDPDFQEYERNAMAAMAAKNGGALVGHNPRMRRSVQSALVADDAYLRQRARNNLAAKQSRDRRKLREIHLSLKTQYLTKMLTLAKEHHNSIESFLTAGGCVRNQ